MGKMKDLLVVNDLHTFFFTSDGVVKAVNGVDLTINKGETLGLVGESGCGKTVLALSIMRLVPSPPGRIMSGKIIFNGKDLLGLDSDEMRNIRLEALHFAIRVDRGGAEFQFGIERQGHRGRIDHRLAAIFGHVSADLGGNHDKFNAALDQVVHEQDQHRYDPINFGKKRLSKKRNTHCVIIPLLDG